MKFLIIFLFFLISCGFTAGRPLVRVAVEILTEPIEKLAKEEDYSLSAAGSPPNSFESFTQRRLNTVAQQAAQSEFFPSIAQLARFGLDCHNEIISAKICDSATDKIWKLKEEIVDGKNIPSKDEFSKKIAEIINRETGTLAEADEEEESEFELNSNYNYPKKRGSPKMLLVGIFLIIIGVVGGAVVGTITLPVAIGAGIISLITGFFYMIAKVASY